VTYKPNAPSRNQGVTLKNPTAQGIRSDPKKDLSSDPKVRLQPEKEAPDTSHWLTRNQSSDFLRMSVTTIGNYERRGKLHPQHAYRRDARGIEHRVAVYDPAELLKLLHPTGQRETPREPGEVAALCFEAFDQGKTIRQIVVDLRETPERVQTLYERWLDVGGADLTITLVAKEALEKLLGQFTSVADLLTLIEGLKQRSSTNG
jgi:hypothetical protein